MAKINNKELIISSIQQSIALKQSLLTDESFQHTLNQTAVECINCFERGNRILLAGNGGSAADAQHIAAELVCRLNFERPGLSAMALACNYSIITAAGNDYDFEHVFARELEANGRKGDLFIAISTSGNSANLLKAADSAKQLGIQIISFGGAEGKLKDLADFSLSVPSKDTPRIQECHIMIGHILCDIIEQSLFGENS